MSSFCTFGIFVNKVLEMYKIMSRSIFYSMGIASRALHFLLPVAELGNSVTREGGGNGQ